MNAPSRKLRLWLISAIIALSACFGAVAVFTARIAPSGAYRTTSIDRTIGIAVPAGWTLQWLGRNGGYLTSRDDGVVRIGENYPVPASPEDVLSSGGNRFLYVPYVEDPGAALARLHDRYFLCNTCAPISITSEHVQSEPKYVEPYLRNLGPTDNARVEGTFVSNGVPRRFTALVSKSHRQPNGRWVLGVLVWESSPADRFEKLRPVMDSIVASITHSPSER